MRSELLRRWVLGDVSNFQGPFLREIVKGKFESRMADWRQ